MSRIEIIGDAVLYLGDCREILRDMDRVIDAVVTDPPYGIGAGQMSFGKWRTSAMPKGDWDAEAPCLEYVLNFGLPTIIWGGNALRLALAARWSGRADWVGVMRIAPREL